MAIEYRLVRSRNPFTGETLYRAAVHVTHRVDRTELVELIADKTTVSSGDVAAVLAELSDALRKQLSKGRPVTLDGIGTLYVAIVGKAVAAPESFNPHQQIERGAIRFRPARELKATQRNFEFRLAGTAPVKGPSPAPAAPSAPAGPSPQGDPPSPGPAEGDEEVA